jgi:hypothetical protein
MVSLCGQNSPKPQAAFGGPKQKEAPQLINAYALMQRPKSVLRILPQLLYHNAPQMSNKTMWSLVQKK